ncbi:MAG: hypothetical protein GQ574_15520 [Crocinitomix sp.]|nr:hypothetical protein [Crocinitomix sp.]
MKIFLIYTILLCGMTSYSQTSGKTVVRNIPISYTTEKSDCLINEILTIGKTTYVTVDFITLEWVDEGGGIESRKIVNNNKKKRTFIITAQTKFSLHDNAKTLKGIISDSNAGDPFVISTNNGRVLLLYVNAAG